MKKYLFILCLCLSTASFAQVEQYAKALRDSSKLALARLGTLEEPLWDKGAKGTFLMNQVTLSNWQAGGQNSISGNLGLNFFANYYHKKWRWANRLDIGYGKQWANDQVIKTDDRFELNSRADRIISKNWSASLNLNFRTQFEDGFEKPEDAVPISGFLAPAYTIVGLGFTFSPNDKFSLFLSPATMKHTMVNDQRLADLGSYGVDAAEVDTLGNIITSGKKNRAEIGAYLNAYFKTPIMKNITFESKLDLFSNYLNNPQNIDVNWENGLFMKVNEYITVNLVAHVIYDDDILFTDADGTGPRTQFRQSLGVGLSYQLRSK